MKCMIFGAGDMCLANRVAEKKADDFVIAADGGFTWAQFLSLAVDMVVGDFDSLNGPVSHECVVHFPVEKDDTDMGLAVKLGIERGYSCFYLYGGTGGRADHTMANYQLLEKLAREGKTGYLIDDRMTATVIRDGSLRLSQKDHGFLSVFATGDRAEGVTLEGLKYPLTNANLTNDFALGVSNQFMGKDVKITVSKGSLLLIGEFLPDDVLSRN